MSAYICSHDHITALASAVVALNVDVHCMHAYREPCPPVDDLMRAARHVGELLLAENQESFDAKYAESSAETFVLSPSVAKALMFKGALSARVVPLLKAIDCYEYQSCEHEGWETSTAKKLMGHLRAALVTRLPGYNDAAWGWQA
jgi:hypothetical protein